MLSPIQPFLLRASLLEVAGVALCSRSRQLPCHTYLYQEEFFCFTCKKSPLRVLCLYLTLDFLCALWTAVSTLSPLLQVETVTSSQEPFMSYVHYDQHLKKNSETNKKIYLKKPNPQWSVWLAWVLLTDNKILFSWKLGQGTSDGAITQISEVWWLFTFLSAYFWLFALL